MKQNICGCESRGLPNIIPYYKLGKYTENGEKISELESIEYIPDLERVKCETVNMLLEILSQLECGIQPKLDNILNKLSFIDIYENECI